MTTTELTAEQRDVLTTCLQRERALAGVPLLFGIYRSWAWDDAEYELQQEVGPRFTTGEWFGRLPEHRRQRYVRAVKDLAAAGLLSTHKEYSKLSHVKLTQAGKKLAEDLPTTKEAVSGEGVS